MACVALICLFHKNELPHLILDIVHFDIRREVFKVLFEI